MHADHFLDLIPLRYAVRYGTKRRSTRLPVWMPPGGIAMLRSMTAVFANEGNGDFLDEAFDLREFDRQKRCRWATGSCGSRRRPATSRRLRSATNATGPASPTRPIRRPTTGWSSSRAAPTVLCEATLLADEKRSAASAVTRRRRKPPKWRPPPASADSCSHTTRKKPPHSTSPTAPASIYKGDIQVADDHAIITV